MYRKLFSARQVLCIMITVLFFACKSQNSSKDDAGKMNADTKGWPTQFGFGKPASPEEIAVLDIDVRPDGRGLPAGSGTVQEGRKVYEQKCASCHGNNGVGGPYNHLVSSDTSKARTIGNYWPFATTVFDYIKRAMPFNSPGSLTNEEVYGVTAFLLYQNKLIDSTKLLNAQSLPKVEMPAKKLFVPDDREGGNKIR